jgi:hypothetical protein
MQTDVQRPAITIRLLPMRFTSWITALSSQVFMLVRSKNFALGKAALISSNMGPEKVFSATVVAIVATLKNSRRIGEESRVVSQHHKIDRLGRERHLRLEVDQDERVVGWGEQCFSGLRLGGGHIQSPFNLSRC